MRISNVNNVYDVKRHEQIKIIDFFKKKNWLLLWLMHEQVIVEQ